MAACDPAFHRTQRFSVVDTAISAQLRAEQLDLVATQHGFEPATRARSLSDHAPPPWTLLRYHAAIREPNWGSCSLELLRDDPATAIVLELWAFPASGEPVHLRELRRAIEALLTRFGYAADS